MKHFGRKFTRESKYRSFDVQTAATYYRNIQILVGISNRCFETHLWTAVQFTGSTLTICLLYTVLTFNDMLPGLLQFGLVLVACMIVVVCTLIMDMASGTILHSKAIRHTLGARHGAGKWLQRFLRSCPVIALRVGTFHKMDKERAPAFIRYILQRTVFLVLKTKTMDLT